MKLSKAFQIVLALATENVLEEKQCDDDKMKTDRKKQLKAICVVENFVFNEDGFVNV